ncbi:hypothetical protein A2997_01365 [Candidatus Nomurabacteria bacterium RIFCSPLOWO2_01_FULL_36_10b]|uniref:Lysine transporter LysE n=1 Tax=Candidatus Nomurabacteria bacterium RIFCSPLOWO2_01_FULL_36_10b TaxID=1801766 RepID=A0A1F6WQJ2_9BACT|nr:MAG: hypothetical protein A2997_01365 [Candidatus Nomurabacteria bacterium RIFCSPLOWO2_01_FULL_36_10b]
MVLPNIIKGILIGILIWIPLGPVVFLCINRTLTTGVRSGVLSCLGASFSDVFYIGIIVFGLHSVSLFLSANGSLIQLIGSIFMLGFAIYLWNTPVRHHIKEHTGGKLVYDFFSTFILNITNPVPLITMPLVFGSLGVGFSMAPAALALYIAIIATLFCASIGLPFLLIKFRHLITGRTFMYMNRAAAVLLALAGGATIVRIIVLELFPFSNAVTFL